MIIYALDVSSINVDFHEFFLIFCYIFQLPNHDYSSLAAHDEAVKSGAGFQILLVAHLAEIFGSLAVKEMYEGSGRQPGSFGNFF